MCSRWWFPPTSHDACAVTLFASRYVMSPTHCWSKRWLATVRRVILMMCTKLWSLCGTKDMLQWILSAISSESAPIKCLLTSNWSLSRWAIFRETNIAEPVYYGLIGTIISVLIINVSWLSMYAYSYHTSFWDITSVWIVLLFIFSNDLINKFHCTQGRSQNYIKGGSKFSKPLLSRDTDSLSCKTLGYQRKHVPSGIWLFTLYCKNKVIRLLRVHCSLLNTANACCCSCMQLSYNYVKITCHSACACLANDLNPVAKHYILILYMKVAKESFCWSSALMWLRDLACHWLNLYSNRWSFIPDFTIPV